MFEILRKRKKQNELNEVKVQEVSKTINIRDFLYLDIERVKSIFAQFEEGLVTGREKVGGTAKEISGRGEGGVPTFIKLAAEGKFIWENEEHETKTLHDYMFQHVENKILDNDMVTNIDNTTVTLDKLKGDELRSEINKKPFLLISGRISLYDYE